MAQTRTLGPDSLEVSSFDTQVDPTLSAALATISCSAGCYPSDMRTSCPYTTLP